MTLDVINIGVYGEIPEFDDNQTEIPRGALAKPEALPGGQRIFDKADVWSDLAPALYEEGAQRRWRPASDIPWETVPRWDDYLELATAQFCTTLSELSLAFLDVLASWNKEISYAFYEVKMMLAGQQLDCARHFEAFRKRALLNGGSLGYESPGNLIRLSFDAQDWTEAVLYVHVLGASFTLDLCRIGAGTAASEAERLIFAYAIQDTARRLAYGLDRLRRLLVAKPQRRPFLNAALLRGENAVAADWLADGALAEALSVLLGRGSAPEQLNRGQAALQRFRAASVNNYLNRLAAAGLEERRENLSGFVKRMIDAQAPVPTAATPGRTA
jgi:hypothetical protein